MLSYQRLVEAHMETKLNVRLLSHTITPELLIAVAAKLCYSPSDINALLESQTEKDIERFINMLTSMGHESPLEHASFTFAIEGVSRALTHQLVRNRIASYSQQSQRYVKETQFDYVIPDDIKRNSVLSARYTQLMESLQKEYDFIVDSLIYEYVTDTRHLNFLIHELKKNNIDYETFMRSIQNEVSVVDYISSNYKKLNSALEKKAIENARYVFPNATETKIICTMNLRSLINFCNHRCCNRAQDEINHLAWEIVAIMEREFPLLAKALGANCQFRPCPEGNMCCGKPYPKK